MLPRKERLLETKEEKPNFGYKITTAVIFTLLFQNSECSTFFPVHPTEAKLYSMNSNNILHTGKLILMIFSFKKMFWNFLLRQLMHLQVIASGVIMFTMILQYFIMKNFKHTAK